MKHKTIIEEDELYEPVEWKCDSCGKIKAYADSELEKEEQPKPGTKPEDWNYHVPCPFARKDQCFLPLCQLLKGCKAYLIVTFDPNFLLLPNIVKL